MDRDHLWPIVILFVLLTLPVWLFIWAIDFTVAAVSGDYSDSGPLF